MIAYKAVMKNGKGYTSIYKPHHRLWFPNQLYEGPACCVALSKEDAISWCDSKEEKYCACDMIYDTVLEIDVQEWSNEYHGDQGQSALQHNAKYANKFRVIKEVFSLKDLPINTKRGYRYGTIH